MRSPSPVRAAALAATILLVGGVASAQDAAPAPSGTPLPQLPDAKIAVVLGSGSATDAGIGQAIATGALAGAKAVGAKAPEVVVARPGDTAALFEKLVKDDDADIVITGPGLGADTIAAAGEHRRGVTFIGIDQPAPCLTLEGAPDETGLCPGDATKLLPNLRVATFREDQAGYLAGMVAAAASPNGRVGMIGAIPTCDWCVRYMQGFELGAKAVKPDVQVESFFVTDSDARVAFADPATGRAVAEAFIDVRQPDVVLAVGGQTATGVMDAACEAGILAVGVDVDQAVAHPRAAGCLLTSATKSLAEATSGNILAIADGTSAPGVQSWDAARDGIGLAPFGDLASLVPPELPDQLAAALAKMKSGSLQTCPDDCGTVGR